MTCNMMKQAIALLVLVLAAANAQVFDSVDGFLDAAREVVQKEQQVKKVSVQELLAEADARDEEDTTRHHGVSDPASLDEEDEVEDRAEFGTARQVRFVNKLDHPVEIFWVKPGSANEEVATASLGAGGSGHKSSTQLGSYVGHMFVFRRKDADARTTAPLDWFRCRASKPKRGYQLKILTGKSVAKAKVDAKTFHRRKKTRDAKKACVDLNDSCLDWATDGECEKNPGYMIKDCPRSCNVCGEDDDDEGSDDWYEEREDDDDGAATAAADFVPRDANGRPIACEDKHELCQNWARRGECGANPSFMTPNCPISCGMDCRELDYEYKCRRKPEDNTPCMRSSDPTARPPRIARVGDADGQAAAVAAAGTCRSLDDGANARCLDAHADGCPTPTLNEVFERMVADDSPFAHMEPVVLHRDPWVVQLRKFLSADECQHVIDKTYKNLVRSTDAGHVQADGTFKSITSKHRTSWNTWCHEDCASDPVIKGIERRTANVSMVPVANHEYVDG